MMLNNVAWDALFTGKVEQRRHRQGDRATEMQKDIAGIFCTLWLVSTLKRETPKRRVTCCCAPWTTGIWTSQTTKYGTCFGRIAEQYGEREIAIADYRKLEKPKEILAVPTSSYVLAQARLKALGANGSGAGK